MRSMLEAAVKDRFGTWRGLARLGLSYVQMRVPGWGNSRYDPAEIRRLVFVCHGNICRSALADILARHEGAKSVSFGLSTATGKPAHAPVAAFAQDMGLDPALHRTSQPHDLDPQPGDLLIAMEVRHAVALRKHPAWGDSPVVLLGTFGGVNMPHLHDPYALSSAYMDACLRRIAAATRDAIRRHPGAIIYAPAS